MKAIWVAGAPSFYGGADTELDHNIELWRRFDVEVHIVPMFGLDPKMRQHCIDRGCAVHEYRADIFKDKVVVSYCNGEFLRLLPEIVEKGKPAQVIWGNCMTWTFDHELRAHKNKWIDKFIFVSNFQKGMLKPLLEVHNPVDELEGYRPYFSPTNISQQLQFVYRTPQEWFALGRISRDDANKFSDDMWNIFYKVCTPRNKKVFILGYGPNAHHKTKTAPIGLDWQTWQPNEIPVKQMYSILHAIIHKTGGSRESYCRIVPEAMMAGVPLIVENDYAFPELIDDGVTGYLCKSSDEMSFRASELAFDEEKRKKMIYTAHDYLVNDIASPSKCWMAWERLLR